MSLITPEIRASTIASVNPVAKLIAAILLALVLLLSIDWASALVALVLEALLLPFAGLAARQFWLRTAPLWFAAPLACLTTVLYGRDSGDLLWQAGFVSVTEGSVSLGVAIGVRILAIGLPGIVLFATTDPTDLADGLGQVLRLPSRFVIGGLAGLRLVGLFIEDWRFLALARRARGVGDSNLVSRIAGQGFSLLVLSVRRGSKLATAMEAKGFGSRRERTWARESTFGRREWTLVAIAVVIAVLAVTLAVALGTWKFVLS
ncbi:energy-coupling factor transporter transmembrane component T family protein [Lacisediminihabitans profunda]|uniref:Energy-coupling factor transporter transmembrane protein EcfT n=1 Tax=Lacisediminihabitans profunda TaxID=2594790 RepID=A0A5C8UMQ1_9MICO|nr:energy-coupling factor transporter transmembrane component T [Lacisediminihabitans profunda]TXN29656.1 energy-coupling factor transporter transmembrane protein EcfT [Lacisediminihabitans profunda]